MAKSQTTFAKKEKEKKRLGKRLEKQEKKEMRKAESKKGKSLDEMMAYLDENGNLSNTPPDLSKKVAINAEDIPVNGIKRVFQDDSGTRKGKITYFNLEKGYGFINDMKSQQRVFVHINQLTEPLGENDEVLFEIEIGHKGPSAINVRSK
jgi:cold shock CspA family protein